MITVIGSTESQGFGPTADGRLFLIPTHDWRAERLPIQDTRFYVDRFVVYARWHPDLNFKVTRLAPDIVEFRDRHLAGLFKYAPDNCFFDEVWMGELPKKQFWGSYPTL